MFRKKGDGRCKDCSSDCPYYLEGFDNVYCKWAEIYEKVLEINR